MSLSGFGLALTFGTGLSYAIEPKAAPRQSATEIGAASSQPSRFQSLTTQDPRLLFPGLGACLLGILCDLVLLGLHRFLRPPNYFDLIVLFCALTFSFFGIRVS